MPYSSGFPSTSGYGAGWGRGYPSSEPRGGVVAVPRCLDPSSVPILLPKLAISPEAAPVVAETAALSVLPLLLMLPTQPPLPSGDSALEPEQQAGESDRMRENRRKRPWPKPQIKKNKAVFLIASPSPLLLSIFSIFDPLGHSSCHLTSIPLAAMDTLFLLCLALTKPLSFSTRSGFPCLPPNLKPLGLDWSLESVRGKGHYDCRPSACSHSYCAHFLRRKPWRLPGGYSAQGNMF